jgi:hypothetical protein
VLAVVRYFQAADDVTHSPVQALKQHVLPLLGTLSPGARDSHMLAAVTSLPHLMREDPGESWLQGSHLFLGVLVHVLGGQRWAPAWLHIPRSLVHRKHQLSPSN